MGYASRDALLGASDLVDRDVDLPTLGLTVKVRSLPAAYSNQATSESLEMVTDTRGRQTATVNKAKLEALQVLHGMVEPKLLSLEDAYAFGQKCGPAWRKVVDTIDEISGIDKEAIDRTNQQFQAGESGEEGPAVGNGTSTGSGRPDLRVSASA